jgi:CheY-like chemotaxis protein
MKENSFILMLEDDPDDRFITQSTMSELGYNTDIKFVKDSQEFFAVLENAALPALILLDYNSSPQNAVEILKTLKTDNNYRSIPVVVLSDSTSPKHARECYMHGASSYINKPTSMAGTTGKIDIFLKYWFTVVTL